MQCKILSTPELRISPINQISNVTLEAKIINCSLNLGFSKDQVRRIINIIIFIYLHINATY